MTILATGLRAMRGWHRPLVANATLMFTLTLVSAVGLIVDDRLLLGESVWVKPMKFGFAMGVYGLTLAWLLSKLSKGRRLGWWLGTVFAVAGLLDVGAVVYAAAHGTFSHFNNDAEPVAETVRTVFSIGVAPLLLITLIIAVLVLIQRTGDRAMTRALRAGLGLAIASMVVALWLSNSAGATPRTLTDANGNPVSMNGGHGIGDPDGNGMFLTNWSTTGGDLRVPHFVGLHAIQVLLLITAILGALATRHDWLRAERVRARLVGVAGLGYTGVFAVLTWQAKRGMPVTRLDRQTLIAFTGVSVLTLVTAAAVVVAARRPSAPPTAGQQRDEASAVTADADAAVIKG
ncbi:hypothetical protein [Micromonospora sp. WMMD812]|uniref:hypothetical protein n=1 Tax=Micromonospora sp. WMMD812 TaxID=3015152 RepID=UPI00248C355F|nr:hypothetical protein [Micromonospora sp. WMMD812]WBB69531.1 hypothetical protein O7603_09325 [Micromonospora sp. WMMD812]